MDLNFTCAWAGCVYGRGGGSACVKGVVCACMVCMRSGHVWQKKGVAKWVCVAKRGGGRGVHGEGGVHMWGMNASGRYPSCRNAFFFNSSILSLIHFGHCHLCPHSLGPVG